AEGVTADADMEPRRQGIRDSEPDIGDRSIAATAKAAGYGVAVDHLGVAHRRLPGAIEQRRRRQAHAPAAERHRSLEQGKTRYRGTLGLSADRYPAILRLRLEPDDRRREQPDRRGVQRGERSGLTDRAAHENRGCAQLRRRKAERLRAERGMR